MAPPRPATDVDALRETLLSHARAVIARDGVNGLTMRALATEAGMAVGMSYKAFTSREELLWELTWRSLSELTRQIDDWLARPGGELADRLMEFSDLQFASQAPDLVAHLSQSPRREELFRTAVEAGIVRSWAVVLTEFLGARRGEGDVREDVDIEAFGFILSAALHHVLTTEETFLVPDRPTLARYVAGVVAEITAVSARSEAARQG